jgi:hypothetical protein
VETRGDKTSGSVGRQLETRGDKTLGRRTLPEKNWLQKILMSFNVHHLDLRKEPPKNIRTIPSIDSPSSGFSIGNINNIKQSSASPRLMNQKKKLYYVVLRWMEEIPPKGYKRMVETLK